MRVAVLGGGTAGFVAAAHLTKQFPALDLYHIYDPTIPTIGVGEGTTPDFQYWLHQTTGIDSETLQQRCQMTRKYAIRFEQWGQRHPTFMHNFYPVGEEYAYHLAADKLVELLEEHVRATQISKRVVDVESDGVQATLTFEEGERLTVDLLFDARGFPATLEESDHLRQSIIPTNAALIRPGPPVAYHQATRSVARPHGWIFIIPLRHRTAYGYIYNNKVNSPQEIDADLLSFLAREGVPTEGEGRALTFPNFISRTFFDGAVFKIGNRASFMEPLEATSISFIVTQMQVASRWPLSLMAQKQHKPTLHPHNIGVVNDYLRRYAERLAFFIGWHYAQGAAFDTPFWRFAQENFKAHWADPAYANVRADFEGFVRDVATFPNPHTHASQFAEAITTLFAAIAAQEAQEGTKLFPQRRSDPKFGLFSTLSFAEVGHGINFFETVQESDQASVPLAPATP